RSARRRECQRVLRLSRWLTQCQTRPRRRRKVPRDRALRASAHGLHMSTRMRPRFVVHAVVATFLIGGIAFAADALVESDREQLEQLASDLTAGRAHQRVDAVLRWTDLSREPVSVSRGGNVSHFDERDDHRLAESFARALAPFA